MDTQDNLEEGEGRSLGYARVNQWLKFLINPYNLLVCGQVRIKETNTIKTHVLKKLEYVLKFHKLLHT